MKRYNKVLTVIVSIAFFTSMLTGCNVLKTAINLVRTQVNSTVQVALESIHNSAGLQEIKEITKVAEEQTPIEEVFKLESVHESVPNEKYYGYSFLTERKKELYKKIDVASRNYWNYIVFTQSFTQEESCKVFYSYVQDNSDVFWLNGYADYLHNADSIGMFLIYQTETVVDEFEKVGYQLTTKAPREEITKQRINFTNATNTILSSINKDASALKKELYVYQYLVRNVKYSDEIAAQIDSDSISDFLSITAYGALINKSTVCSGYSKVFAHLMTKLGVDTVQVFGTSDGENHQWNMVQIEDDYYHVDSTWGSLHNFLGKPVITYDYFNLTDEQITEDHIITNLCIEPENEGEEKIVVGPVAPKTSNDKYTFRKYFTLDGLKTANISGIKNAVEHKLEEFYISLPATFTEKTVDNYINENFERLSRIYKKITGKNLTGTYNYSKNENLCYLTVE